MPHSYPTRGSKPVNNEESPSRPPASDIGAAAGSFVARKAKRPPDTRDTDNTDDVRFAFSYILGHEFSKLNGELLYTVS
jgi:hypothetical protein